MIAVLTSMLTILIKIGKCEPFHSKIEYANKMEYIGHYEQEESDKVSSFNGIVYLWPTVCVY